jgi:hypothetical protein
MTTSQEHSTTFASLLDSLCRRMPVLRCEMDPHVLTTETNSLCSEPLHSTTSMKMREFGSMSRPLRSCERIAGGADWRCLPG